MAAIGFIGAGNMAEAMIKGILSAKLYKPDNIFVSDIRTERLEYLRKQYNVKVFASNADLAGQADVVVLSVKPQNIRDVLAEIKGALKKGAVVISIAAGIKTDLITGCLGGVAIIRAMPNTPAMVGAGATAIIARNTDKKQFEIARDIFSAVGKAEVVEDEELLDAVTALSGSGPAYFFLLMENMIKAGVEMGLSEQAAKKLVLQTAKGAAMLAENADTQGQSPAMLREKVTSPGGTTAAALKIFHDAGFKSIVLKALTAAHDRSKELSEISK